MAKIADLKTHKFIVALSFPGARYRKDVKKFYELLRTRLPKPQHAIFFDEAYQGDLTQKNLDDLLKDLYRNALLFVPFFSEEYQRSKWCMNVEWATIKADINRRADEAVFYIRCDDTEIEGITWKDGCQDLRNHSLDEIAGQVAERAKRLMRQEKKKKKGAIATSDSPSELADGSAAPATSASLTVFAPPPKQTKVLFLSALGQWTEGLQMLLPKGAVSNNLRCEVVDWQASMKELKEVEGTYGQAALKTQVFNERAYPIEEWLYVFVSPFSLAAKWAPYKNLRVLGPAFGSCEDISIHMRRNVSFTKDQQIQVGMIDDDITSSILFQILVSSMNNWFFPAARCGAQPPCKSTIKELFNLESFGGWKDRLSLLDPQHTSAFDACVFTARELINIKNSKEHHAIKPREILKIDPPIAHILQIDGYVPRAVYFIQALQYYREQEINNLLNWLQTIVPRKKERKLVGGIRPLLPGDEAARQAQKTMIERAQALGINIHSVNFERLKDGVLSL
jgi:hypothetical protein